MHNCKLIGIFKRQNESMIWRVTYFYPGFTVSSKNDLKPKMWLSKPGHYYEIARETGEYIFFKSIEEYQQKEGWKYSDIYLKRYYIDCSERFNEIWT